MSQPSAIRGAEFKDLVPVRSIGDLDWMVKESELITGTPGREFVVAGADRPAFHVQIDAVGYQIVRVDQDDASSTPMRATTRELANHTLGNALLCGLLYTTALH